MLSVAVCGAALYRFRSRGACKAKSRVPVGRAPVIRKRKNIHIDRDKLDAARTALGALTETATIDAALDFVVFRTNVFSALERVAVDGGFAPARRLVER